MKKDLESIIKNVKEKNKKNKFYFDDFFSRLQAYKREFGDCLVKYRYKTADGYELGKKLGRVRHRALKVTDEQVKKLEAMGVVMGNYPDETMHRLELLIEYIEEHNKIPNKYSKAGSEEREAYNLYRCIKNGDLNDFKRQLNDETVRKLKESENPNFDMLFSRLVALFGEDVFLEYFTREKVNKVVEKTKVVKVKKSHIKKKLIVYTLQDVVDFINENDRFPVVKDKGREASIARCRLKYFNKSGYGRLARFSKADYNLLMSQTHPLIRQYCLEIIKQAEANDIKFNFEYDKSKIFEGADFSRRVGSVDGVINYIVTHNEFPPVRKQPQLHNVVHSWTIYLKRFHSMNRPLTECEIKKMMSVNHPLVVEQLKRLSRAYKARNLVLPYMDEIDNMESPLSMKDNFEKVLKLVDYIHDNDAMPVSSAEDRDVSRLGKFCLDLRSLNKKSEVKRVLNVNEFEFLMSDNHPIVRQVCVDILESFHKAGKESPYKVDASKIWEDVDFSKGKGRVDELIKFIKTKKKLPHIHLKDEMVIANKFYGFRRYRPNAKAMSLSLKGYEFMKFKQETHPIVRVAMLDIIESYNKYNVDLPFMAEWQDVVAEREEIRRNESLYKAYKRIKQFEKKMDKKEAEELQKQQLKEQKKSERLKQWREREEEKKRKREEKLRETTFPISELVQFLIDNNRYPKNNPQDPVETNLFNVIQTLTASYTIPIRAYNKLMASDYKPLLNNEHPLVKRLYKEIEYKIKRTGLNIPEMDK